MVSDSLAPVDSKTLRENIITSLREGILDGVLEPGSQLNQVAIAEELKVSRAPVREALSQLEQEGLVRNVPRRGTFVTDMSPTYIDELYSVRRVLEGFAVRRLAGHPDVEQIARLRSILEELQNAASRENQRELADIDLRFHAEIIAGAHNALLSKIWQSIETGVRRCVGIRHRIYGNLIEIVGTHPDIVNAIEASDTQAACELLDTHIREAGEILQVLWSSRQSAAKSSPEAI